MAIGFPIERPYISNTEYAQLIAGNDDMQIERLAERAGINDPSVIHTIAENLHLISSEVHKEADVVFAAQKARCLASQDEGRADIEQCDDILVLLSRGFASRAVRSDPRHWNPEIEVEVTPEQWVKFTFLYGESAQCLQEYSSKPPQQRPSRGKRRARWWRRGR